MEQKTFYISDTHFGHKRVIQMDDRPFETIEQMEEEMVKRWNRKVLKGDRVYILGDFCWNGRDEWVRLLKKLNGQKFLISGNHDNSCKNEEVRKLLAGVYDYKEIKDNGRNVILSHYPIPFYRHDCDANVYMLYGHLHNTIEELFMQDLKEFLLSEDNRGDSSNKCNIYNCFCGFYDYEPVTLDEIIKYNCNKNQKESCCGYRNCN